MYRKDNTESTASTLLRYFVCPLSHQFQDLLYTEYYQQYILYSTKTNQLQSTDFLEQENSKFSQFIVRKRVRNEAIARIITVSPRVGELFYLCALLFHKPAYSFKQLRTVEDKVYPTFQEAAAALGLFENQTEGMEAMKEAVDSYCSPSQLRFLFAHILLNIPVAAVELFKRYQEELTADYLDRFDSATLVMQHCLLDLSNHLACNSARLSEFGLSEPEEQVDKLFMEEATFGDRRIELSMLATEHEQLLLEQQATAYKTILNIVLSPNQAAHSNTNCFFLDGKAGREKTFTVNVLVNRLRGRGDVVVISGSTALSVTLYERGRTAHSTFGIPVIEVFISIKKFVKDNMILIVYLFRITWSCSLG